MRVRFSPRALRYVNLRATLALLAPLCAAAQEPSPPGVTLRGTVVAAGTGGPLPFTIVALRPGLIERFTDEHGAFAFAGVSRGGYRLVVRQIGYTPADTSITVHGDADVSVRIELTHIAVELPPITVTGRTTCTTPGPPQRAVTPALAAVFDQLLENARRFELLADSYPFRFLHERTYRTVTPGADTLAAAVDSIEQTSRDERQPYRPGQVVHWGRGPYRDRRVVLLPALTQLADTAFINRHCFRLAGRDTIEGKAFVRLDFAPAARLRSADLEGAAYLDSLTYQLRYTRVSVTRPERALPDVVALVAQTRFHEIAPGIMLHDHVRAVTTLRTPARSAAAAQRIEEQRLLSVHFVRPFLGEP
jgi:hypothetical protein